MTRRLAWKPARASSYEIDALDILGWKPGDDGIHHHPPSPWQRTQPGDRIWVREAHYVWRAGNRDGTGRQISYRATEPDAPTTWTPSIHMPRWASRLTLIVTATKIERLQEISARDCLAEGIPPITDESYWRPPIPPEPNLPAIYCGAFARLWADIHGPESWDANPEVVAITFRVARANIDSAESSFRARNTVTAVTPPPISAK
jgi:hypothetical protein